MNLINKHSHLLIEEAFPKRMTAGFTTSTISGKDVPQDMRETIGKGAGVVPCVWCSQPHGAEISFAEKEGIFPTDGLITSKNNLNLVIRTADCLPLFFYEPAEDYIGLLHLGWKSLGKGMLKTLADFFKDKNPGKMTFIAGPGLRKCCYEVKEDFLKNPLASCVEQRNRKYYFDPLRFVREELSASGFDYQLYDTGICTLCTDTPLFSYRKDKTDKRILSFIVKS